VDRRMTAPDNENYSVGRVDGERDFLHLQVDAPGAVQHDEMETGRDFGRLADPRKIRLRPWGAEAKRLGRPAVEVPHIRWKRLVAPVEGARQSRAEQAEVFLRRIDFHRGIDLQEVIEPAGVVAVTMRHDGEIELPQVDALGLDVMREDLGVV